MGEAREAGRRGGPRVRRGSLPTIANLVEDSHDLSTWCRTCQRFGATPFLNLQLCAQPPLSRANHARINSSASGSFQGFAEEVFDRALNAPPLDVLRRDPADFSSIIRHASSTGSDSRFNAPSEGRAARYRPGTVNSMR